MFREWLLRPVVKLLQGIAMDQAQLETALSGVADSLTAVGDQLTKATAEIVAEVGNIGQTTPGVDAAVAKLQAVSTALAAASKALDDLNPDAPTTGSGTGPTGEETLPGGAGGAAP